MRIRALSRLPIPCNTHVVLRRSAFQSVCFTTGYALRAARRPRRAPVHAPERKDQRETLVRKPEQDEVSDFSFWPTKLLQNANSAGALSLNWTEAIQFLTKFRDLQPSPRSDSVQELCLEYEIKPLTLTLLSRLLNRSGFKDCQATARRLIIAASYLHDPGATLQLVTEAIRTSSLTHPDIIGPRTHLEILVKEDENPAAMILLGVIRETQGKTDEALSLYEGATNADSDTYTGVETVDDSIGEAWVKVSQLKLRKGDSHGAKAAIEKGAFQYDQPMAYYYLAMASDQDSPDYPQYLMKAAASGVAEAAQSLGIYYDTKWKNNLYIPADKEGSTESEVKTGSSSPTKSSLVSEEESEANRLLASEWFSVAAEAGLPYSRISLAIILRSDKFVQKGMDWLNLEEFPANWADGVAMLKESWWDPERDLTQVSINQLQKGKT